MENRPTGRKKHVEGSTEVHRRGDGLGTGPAGTGSNFSSSKRPASGGGSSPKRSSAPVRGGGMSIGLIVIIAIVFFLFRGNLGGGTDMDTDTGAGAGQQTQTAQSGGGAGDFLSMLLGGGGSYSSGTASYGDWPAGYQPGKLNTSVAEGARAKRTVIKGDGTDDNVILVYLCGTDLESKNGMASRDLAEMAAASLNSHVRIYVYTGGCKKWKTQGISTSVNQIYEVRDGGIKCLDDDRGNKPMVDPNTLVDFLTWAKNNTSGNRYDLIFWDHGGGSVSGYGYDEKRSAAGSMNLASIGKALKAGGITFDFVGFDACLMATVETALVVSDYADYLIASEETEPGVGWYYTDWLTDLAKDPGKPTIEVGQQIADTFTSACAKSAAGQKTTLSVIDLAELSLTVPDALKSFASSTSQMIAQNEYQAVSDARSSAREFASSSRIDQVDLVHLARNLGTSEASALADALQGAVKYNITSPGMTNSYGLSIYFPMKRVSSVDSMVNTYEAIGMDAEYTRMIQEAASMNVYGQAAAGGTGGAAGGLFGGSASEMGSEDTLTQLFTSLLGGDFSSFSGLTSANSSFLGKGIDPATAAAYISQNHFPAEELVWQDNGAGDEVISIDEKAWSTVRQVELNTYFDDGQGYVDLGMDNIYEFDDNGNLLAPADGEVTGITIGGHLVAYYFMDQTADMIMGYVPAFLNGDRVKLLIAFEGEEQYGRVVGANYDYEETDSEVIAKNLTEISAGDELDFFCDFYGYDRTYQDSYYLGETLTVNDPDKDLRVVDKTLEGGKSLVMYRFTDMYGKEYWTPALER